MFVQYGKKLSKLDKTPLNYVLNFPLLQKCLYRVKSVRYFLLARQ